MDAHRLKLVKDLWDTISDTDVKVTTSNDGKEVYGMCTELAALRLYHFYCSKRRVDCDVWPVVSELTWRFTISTENVCVEDVKSMSVGVV